MVIVLNEEVKSFVTATTLGGLRGTYMYIIM